MFKISSSAEYAARIMVRLAASDGAGPLSAETIAAAENIPRDYVDQILLRLRRAGLAASRRGAAGGYLLARPPSGITMGMILRAVDEGVFEEVCGRFAEGHQRCTHTGTCGIRPVWLRLADLVEGFLDGVTLAQLLSPEPCVESRVSLLFGGGRGEPSVKGS